MGERRDKHCFKVLSSSPKMVRDEKEIKVVTDICQILKKVSLFSFSLEFWYVVADLNMTLELRFSANIADDTAGRLISTECTLRIPPGQAEALEPTWSPADGEGICG